ncbi:Nuclear receptor coactivator 1 [Harpegnathos saltator]|uniref:Nuclear receptor coactivator 1 n=1 Tax=Harpegnathos saltator TaxID=610380 RepID=E2BTX3_HARSA|nr:Nuclear receptor coactivator 1 [Harpegnathos saltator]
MSAITGSITKKRKKSDAKPQSQINKCLNEKRRRTQENLYIDELAELISSTDMSSGKTDKCQILQRTVDQVRRQIFPPSPLCMSMIDNIAVMPENMPAIFVIFFSPGDKAFVSVCA